MNDLQIFKNENFGEIRILKINNEPWFIAKDICKILEIKNTTDAIKRLDNDEVTRLNLGGLSGETNIVNEYGLYNLILASRKKEAKEFKRWITHEVIPAIRKTGGYIAGEKDLDEAELILKAMNVLNKKVEVLRQEKDVLELKNSEQDRLLQEQKPKVLFADSVETSKSSILIGELAKIIKQNGHDIGQNRLFEWLRKNNYLISRKGTDYNMPTQKSMNLGLFEVKETSITHSDGHISISKTAKVTGKGQVYFVNKFIA